MYYIIKTNKISAMRYGLFSRWLWFAFTFMSISIFSAQMKDTKNEDGTISLSLLIRGVRVIPGDGSLPLPPQDIVIREGRIVHLENTGTLEFQEIDNVIDADGKTVMPGLIDMHIHLWDDAILPG
jgi:imidazolonepropionase-like amidohydrolase